MLTFFHSKSSGLSFFFFHFLLLLGWTSSAHAVDASTKRGIDFRTDISVSPTLFELRYDGPSEPYDGEPREELHLSAVGVAIMGHWGFGLGFWDGHRNRWGLDGSLALGPTVGGAKGLPHTDVIFVSLWSIGPSYSRVLSRSLEIDFSIRGSGFAFAGGRTDIGASDNVIEFPHHYGFLGRVGGLYRFTPESRFGVVTALQGGHYFAGHQSATLGILNLGLQFN